MGGLLLQTRSTQCPSSQSHFPSATFCKSEATPPWPSSKGEESPARCPVPGSQGRAETCCSSSHFFLVCYLHCFSGEDSSCSNHCTSDHIIFYSIDHLCTSCGFFSLHHHACFDLIPCYNSNNFNWTSVWAINPLQFPYYIFIQSHRASIGV